MQFLTPEVIFSRLVVNELERHKDSMCHLKADQQNELNTHHSNMMQYTADLVAAWSSGDRFKCPIAGIAAAAGIADDIRLATAAEAATMKHFIENDAVVLWDVRTALFPPIDAHYNMNAATRSALLPSIVAAAPRLCNFAAPRLDGRRASV